MTIQLIPMNEQQYIHFLDIAIPGYAEEKIKAGTWTKEEALERSRKEYASLLPQGIETENHELFSVQHDGQSIGILWLHIRHIGAEKHAFIYDIELDEAERGKGYGKATMAALDDYARHEGIKKIELHVFGHNTRAISLYEKSGYETTDLIMAKYL